jgi:hypothetical protein
MLFVNKPAFDEGGEYPLYFSMNMRCRTAGQLFVKVGELKILEQTVEQNNGFVEITNDNLTWNGAGDFYLSFTGEADFYGLTIYTDRTEILHKTFFEMSDRLIEFGAQQLDENGNIKKESGIVVQPKGAGLYAKDENENQAIIAAYADGKVVLEGSQIQLKGNLTTDGNFKVREDGSIEAKHALFNGFIQRGTAYVDNDNYKSLYKSIDSNSWEFDITTTAPILIFEHTDIPIGSIILNLPGTDINASSATRAELEYARGFVGGSIIIYNYTAKNFDIKYTDSNGEHSAKAESLKSDCFIKMDCKLGYIEGKNEGREFVYWDIIINNGKAIKIKD